MSKLQTTVSVLIGAAIFIVSIVLLLLNIDAFKVELTTSNQVDSSGGIIEITEGELVGFKIEVLPESFSDAVDFTITSEPFTDDIDNEAFDAITPLIHIDNGHVVSDIMMDVTVPISIDTETEHAMAFYYDEETGEFEALPTLSLSNDQIVVATTHFSSIVISKIQKEQLLDWIMASPYGFDSGFVPGVDDWQFRNYGSEIAPGGHCQGQTYTMLWYYLEQKQKLGKPSLNDLYNNETPGYWVDDEEAYKFASVIQNAEIDTKVEEYYLDRLSSPDWERFFDMAYALKVTGKPQFLGIFRYDYPDKESTEKDLVDGHAIMVYKITYNVNQYEIWVADPNFSGDESRYIPYTEENGFGTYSSGTNAQETNTQDTLLYTEFQTFGNSAIVDFSLIETEYNNMLDGTIGEDDFTWHKYYYVSGYNASGSEIYTLLDGEIEYEGIENAPLDSNVIKIKIVSQYVNQKVVQIKNQTPIELKKYDNKNIVYFEITLTEGVNDIAFYNAAVYTDVNKDGTESTHYSSYDEFTITFTGEEPVEEPGPVTVTELLGVYELIEASEGAPASFDERFKLLLTKDQWFIAFDREGMEVHTNVTFDLVTQGEIVYISMPRGQKYYYNREDETLRRQYGTEDEYVIYQKVSEVEYYYDLYYDSTLVTDRYGSIVSRSVSPLEETIHLDDTWVTNMNYDNDDFHQFYIKITTNRPRIKVEVVDESNTILYSDMIHPFLVDYVSYEIETGTTKTLTILIYIEEAGEWTLLQETTTTIIADFSGKEE